MILRSSSERHPTVRYEPEPGTFLALTAYHFLFHFPDITVIFCTDEYMKRHTSVWNRINELKQKRKEQKKKVRV